MTWRDRGGALIRSLVLVSWTLLVLIYGSTVLAQDPFEREQPDVWLVTYGPGEIYWQRFGHNAIWIRDSDLGLDHVFNFGFFDFGQEDFFLRFLQGRMLYFSAARPAQEEFAGYIDENRSIRAQRLDLAPEKRLALLEFLLEEVRPENRDYLYDYYLNNCSTRVRDAIDLAMDGALQAEFGPIPAPQTWRDHTRRLTEDDFWLYLGLEVGLGAGVDREINRWDEMFIPATLADSLASLRVSKGGESGPLVIEDVMLFESSLDPPGQSTRTTWPRYLLFSLAALSAAWLLCRLTGPRASRLLSRSWLAISGLAGLALLFFWFGTDHAVARMNTNLLVFCPLWIILAFWKGREKLSLAIVSGMAALSFLLMLLPLPFAQYNPDVLAMFLPFNLASAWVLFTASNSNKE